MQIDVKNGSEKLILAVGSMILEFKRQDKTVWGSFKYSPSNLCLKHFDIPLFFNFHRLLMAYLLYTFGFLNWMNIYEKALIVPNIPLLNKGFIKAIRQRNVSVILYGPGIGALNSKSEWTQARNMGVSGICSDVPSLLSEWLIEHPLE